MDVQRKRRFLRRPSPAMVVACIGLSVALSGTGYAVTVLPRNSVGTAQLKANAVNSAKVKPRSLRADDFALGQLPAGQQGPPGAAGPPGPPGLAGATGAQGVPGTARAYATVSPSGAINTARSFKAVSVRDHGTGVYCVHFDPSVDLVGTTAVASLQFYPGSAGVLPGGCGSAGFGDGVQVNTANASGTATDLAFTLIIG